MRVYFLKHIILLLITMIQFATSLFLCLLTLSAYGQDSTIQYRPVHVIIKLAPLSLLLDPDATIQGGLEVRTGPRSSVQAEVGFGHKGLSVVTDEKQNFADWSIWRVRSEWRHYTGRYRTSRKKTVHIRSRAIALSIKLREQCLEILIIPCRFLAFTL